MKQLRNLIAVTAALLPVLGLASCSQEDLPGTDPVNGQEITTTISVSAPEVFGTRTAGVFGAATDYLQYNATSGTPSIGNVKLDEHPLSFTVGIYRAKTTDGNTSYTLIEKQEKLSVANTEAYFNFRLVKGQNYRLVAYADFSTTGKDDLENIPVAYDLNDELDDAFFVSEDFTADEHVAAVLRRPYGKLRLVARDFTNFAKDPNFKINKVEVTYNKQSLCGVTTMNALTGDFDVANSTVEATGSKTFEAKPVCYTQEFDANGLPLVGEDGTPGKTGVFTMYLPANFGEEDTSGKYTPATDIAKIPQSWMYPFDVKVTYTNEKNETCTLERSYAFDIPVKRNWLTTVDVYDFWTANSNIKVTVDPIFDGEITASPEEIVVNSYADLHNALVNISTHNYTGRIKLGSDIVVTKTLQVMPGLQVGVDDQGGQTITPVHESCITIDFNGHTLTPAVVEGECVTPVIVAFSQCNYKSELILEDSSKGSTGGIVPPTNATGAGFMAVESAYNGKVTINSGRYINFGDAALIYGCDVQSYFIDYGWEASEIVINGGWFENRDGNVVVTDGSAGNITGDWLINIFNNHDMVEVHINGGSFLDYNPENGDNVSRNTRKVYENGEWKTIDSPWVGEGYRVIKAPYGEGRTLHTVVSSTDPRYY